MVKSMIKKPLRATLPAAAMLLCACGNGGNGPVPGEDALETQPPAVTFEADPEYNLAAKPGGPVRFAYRIVGTPVVGQPVTIDLEVSSNIGDRPVTLTYRNPDKTALSFPESQAATVPLVLDDERAIPQQVTVIPMREGRLYLNVAAEIETETGSLSSITAIPIEVGAKPREPEENGTVATDEDGELVRSLPADES